MGENSNLVMQGFDQLGRAMQPAVDQQWQDKADAKPLSRYEQALAALMSRRIEPREVAVRLHHGLPFDAPAPSGEAPPVGSGAPMPGAPSQEPPPAIASQPGPSGTPQYGYTPPPIPAPQAQAPQAPAPSFSLPSQPSPPSFMAPQNRGDMNALLRAAPFIEKGQSPEQRMMELLIKENGKNNRNATTDTTVRRGQDLGMGKAAAQLSESARATDAKVELGYEGLRTRIEISKKMIDAAASRQRVGHGQNLQLESLKLRWAALKNKRDNITKLRASIGELAGDQGVADQIDEFSDGVSEEADSLMQDVAKLQQYGNTNMGSSNPATGAPADMGIDPNTPDQPPINGAPPLSGPAVKEPSSPVAPPATPQAARRVTTSRASGSMPQGPRPTGRTKTDKTGVVWEEMSDGSARKKGG